jgi:uncharacterized protein YcbK (DUF882 family)
MTDNTESMLQKLSRRDLVKGLAVAPLFYIAKPALAAESKSLHSVRSLSFLHLHTDEKLKVTYFENGKYVKGALDEINYILRDFRNDKTAPIDKALLDKLVVLRAKLRSNSPFEIISAYRSPETNAMLHARSGGVATKSQHLLGKAIDIRLADRDLREVQRAALSLGGGGVGYYARSGFVHLDTGPERSWG